MARPRSLIKEIFKPITFIVIGVFLLGVVVGIFLQKELLSNKLGAENKSQSSSQSLEKMQSERHESAVNRSKERVNNYLKKDRITKEQADLITKKIDEVYASAKESSDDINERSSLRSDIKKWTEENDVSMKYFIGIY